MNAKKMNKMMNNGGSISNEEFSFPVITNNPLSNFMLSSSSSSSSSLWRISSRVYHHQDLDFEEKRSYYYDNDYHMEVRSMCEEILPSNYHRREIESFSSTSFTNKELEVEESMDYLWEDFNEEEKEVVKERKSIDGDMSSVFKVTNKMMGRRHSSGSGRSSSSKMLMIGKLLKGLVSIRKSATHLKLSKSRF